MNLLKWSSGKTDEAFLWYRDGGKDILATGVSHWRIIDGRFNEPIYNWLKASERSDIPMVWGYVRDDPNQNGLIVTFLTHLSPGKQDLEYIPAALKSLQQHYGRAILDYEILHTQSPILESFTPSGAPPASDPEEGELPVLRRDELPDGTIVQTSDLRSIGMMFETIVFGGPRHDEAYYEDTEREALDTHYKVLDSLGYDKNQLHTSATGLRTIRVVPEEGEGHSNSERPFIYYRPANMLFYTTDECHHFHIIPKINDMLTEEGYPDNGWGERPGEMIHGDVTSVENSGKNWIKFINGHRFPRSVVDFLQSQFGPREVVWAGDGWIPVSEEQIEEDK